MIERPAGREVIAAPEQRPLQGSFPIVELRQYRLHPGQRETLIELFEREFIETQEATGMKVIGTFRDLDRPDFFVWLRGFSDMDARLSGLSAFYGGPTWAQHRDAANATMIDSDNVLLLEAPRPDAEFQLGGREAPGEQARAGLVLATIFSLDCDPSKAERVFCEEVRPKLEKAGVATLAWFVPELAANTFPRLPVREGEKVLVWFAGFTGVADLDARQPAIADAIVPLLQPLAREVEVLRLEPTARSQLRPNRPSPGTARDFDFLFGRWSVTHRKLEARGVASSKWRTYSGTAETRPLLGGSCNIEEHLIAGPASSGIALRSFDRSTGRWAIYWVSELDGRLQAPVHGCFCGDEGQFEGEDMDGDRPIRVKFLWRRLTRDTARWEQAFSYDEGRTWETNWTMDFERAA
jgi:hypothetical protein